MFVSRNTPFKSSKATIYDSSTSKQTTKSYIYMIPTFFYPPDTPQISALIWSTGDSYQVLDISNLNFPSPLPIRTPRLLIFVKSPEVYS